MASSVIASRLKTALDKLIHTDQKCFIAGRIISENVRLIYDILFETKQHDIPGLILAIDFQRAFYSVLWTLLKRHLIIFI